MKIRLRKGLFRLRFLVVFCFNRLLSSISIINGHFSYRNGITITLIAHSMALLFDLKLTKVSFDCIDSNYHGLQTLQALDPAVSHPVMRARWRVQLPNICFQITLHPQLSASL